ncbi:MAG: ribosome biogenesis GTP-binding protein YihA/YsxC [Bacteroidia bacterium]|jgi:GTP-binding protein
MGHRTVEFIASSAKVSQCPSSGMPEYAFIGRSNVGKSSLLNLLAGGKGPAKTSSTPGKTRLINHFLVNNRFYLVDLPGYGYAKVSKSLRRDFDQLIHGYLAKTQTLLAALVLIDCRLPLQNLDREMLLWLAKNNIPCAIVYTKIDKLSKLQGQRQIQTIQAELKKDWGMLPPEFMTSAFKKTGQDSLWDWMETHIPISQSVSLNSP